MPRRYFDDDMDDDLDLEDDDYELDDEDEDDDESEYDDDDEDDDEFDYDEDEDDDEDEVILRVEQAFRRERTRIRDCDDLQELRSMRTTHEDSIAGAPLSQAARIRSHDLIELIDDRITDIKAQHRSPRGR